MVLLVFSLTVILSSLDLQVITNTSGIGNRIQTSCIPNPNLDQTIRVWSVHTGACLSVLTGHTDLVRTIHFNSQYIVSGSYDQSIKVWDLHSGTLVLDLPHAHNGRVFKVALSVTRIVSCSQDKVHIFLFLQRY